MTIRMIISVDVDHFPGSEVGIRRILDIIEKRDILATFFVAGKFAEEYENVIMEIYSKGHEIGCHGYSHGLDTAENFVDLEANEQKKRLEKSSEILKNMSLLDIISKIFLGIMKMEMDFPILNPSQQIKYFKC